MLFLNSSNDQFFRNQFGLPNQPLDFRRLIVSHKNFCHFCWRRYNFQKRLHFQTFSGRFDLEVPLATGFSGLQLGIYFRRD